MPRRPTHHRFLAAAAGVIAAIVTTSAVRAQDATPASVPATTPATQSAEADREKELAEALAARKGREEELKALPAVKVKSLRELVHFTIEGDDVILRTSIPPMEMGAVVVDGKPTLITVSAQRADGPADAGGDAAAYQPPTFTLIRHEYATPGAVAITHVTAIAPRVSISKTSEGGGEFRNVDFIQSDEFLEEGDARVRFYVQEHRDDQPVVDLKLTAANVNELRRKYPAETMRYLEPIFREFGQSAVLFQVDARAAWQVLGGDYAPPADVTKQVDALLARLDADDAKQRDAALKELDQLGQQAALVLLQRDRAKLTEEQQSRVETFLAPYKPLTDDEAARMRTDAEFLLTALSAEEPELAKRALERLKAVAKQPVAFDVNATGNARAEAIAKLRAQLIPASTRPATTQSTKTPPAEAL